MRLFLLSILIATLSLCSTDSSAKKNAANEPKPVEKQLYLAGQLLFSCPKLALHEKTDFGTLTQGFGGWFFREEADFTENYNLFPETRWFLARFAQALKEKNTALVFIPIPSRSWVAENFLDHNNPVQGKFNSAKAKKNFAVYIARLRELGIIVPDLTPTLEAARKTSEPFFFKRDHHWTSYGSSATAWAVFRTIFNLPGYKNATHKKFETSFKDKQLWKTAMPLNIQRVCETDMPAEEFPTYVTKLKASSDASALFGDEDESEPSVLVGSSFSALEQFNFDGFLSQYSGLEIANYAIAGGQLFNSIISLTSSEGFEASHPPFFFWESPSHYDLNDNSANSFRQIVPATEGVCQGENVVAEDTLTIEPEKTTKLLKLNQPNIRGSRYYLYLSTPNMALAKFTLQFEYKDRDGEWFPIDRTDHFQNTGRFFVELNEEIDSTLISVSLINPLAVKAEMQVKLCKAPQSHNSIEILPKG